MVIVHRNLLLGGHLAQVYCSVMHVLVCFQYCVSVGKTDMHWSLGRMTHCHKEQEKQNDKNYEIVHLKKNFL